jgi:hypothetical protein
MLARRVRAGDIDRLGPLADDLLDGRLSLDDAARRLLEGT